MDEVAGSLDQPDKYGYRLGDHLAIKHALLPIPFSPTYYHHGIYIGNGRIIHASKSSGRVKESKIAKFEKDSIGRIKILNSKLRFTPHQVVANARSKIGKVYELNSFNCEHFARWCRTGKRSSRQITSAKIFGDELSSPLLEVADVLVSAQIQVAVVSRRVRKGLTR